MRRLASETWRGDTGGTNSGLTVLGLAPGDASTLTNCGENMDTLFQKIVTALDEAWQPLVSANNWQSPDWTRGTVRALDGLRDSVAAACTVEPESMRCFHHEQISKEPTPGEYLLDFTWTTWPYVFKQAPSLVPRNHYEILLAVESEWGKESSPALNFQMVLDDFCKLVDVKARYKMLVYSYHPPEATPSSLAELHASFEHIVRWHRNFDPRESWLFVGVPWKWPENGEKLHRVVHTLSVDGRLKEETGA